MNRREFLQQSAIGGLATVLAMQTTASLESAEPAVTMTNNGPDGRWRQPIADGKPIWGHREGLQVGIWPASVEDGGDGGPRGLFRIGYPIINGGKSFGLVNFIAVEPIVKGRRGLSELERSATDGKPGKLFWTGEAKALPAQSAPDPGTVNVIAGVDWLWVRVQVERFDNGAQPVVDLGFRADRPGEIQLSLTAAPGSEPMDYCVVTATMGNYERLRLLWLKDRTVQASTVWPGFDGSEFTPDAFFPSAELLEMPGGDLVVCATSDEKDPHSMPPDPAAWWWAYRGSFPVTQYWRKPRSKDQLKVRVNGRRVYWASHNPIPGGLAFENFDLMEPFYAGQEFVFGLTRRSAADVQRGRIG